MWDVGYEICDVLFPPGKGGLRGVFWDLGCEMCDMRFVILDMGYVIPDAG